MNNCFIFSVNALKSVITLYKKQLYPQLVVLSDTNNYFFPTIRCYHTLSNCNTQTIILSNKQLSNPISNYIIS